MIIGSPPALRARLLKARALFPAPLRAARRLRKNNGVRFRDVPGGFFPGTARNVRRNLFGLRGESVESWRWRRARWRNNGSERGLSVQRLNVGEQKVEVLRRADRAPAPGTRFDPDGAGRAD